MDQGKSRCPHLDCTSDKTWKNVKPHVNGHLQGELSPTLAEARPFWTHWLDGINMTPCDVCNKMISKSHRRHNGCKAIMRARVAADGHVPLPLDAEPAQAPVGPAAPNGSVRMPPRNSLPTFEQIMNCGYLPTKKLPPPSCALKFTQCITKVLGYTLAHEDEVATTGWKGYYMLTRCILRTSPQRNGLNSLRATELERRMDLWLNGDWDVLWREALASRGVCPPPQKESDRSKVRKAIRLIQDERISDASKALLSNGVAPTNAETLETLKSKHPQMPPVPTPADLPEAFAATEGQVLAAINSFPKGSAPGYSRITSDMLKLAVKQASTKPFLPLYTSVINRILRGDLPRDVKPVFAGGELIALNKPPLVCARSPWATSHAKLPPPVRSLP